MNNRKLAIKIVEDLCNKFDVELGGVAVIAVQNILEEKNAAKQSVQADAGCALCGHGIGYHNNPAVGHKYQEPVAQPRS